MNKKKNSNPSETMSEGNLFADSVMASLTSPEGAAIPPRHRGRPRSTVTEDRPPLTSERMREILEDIHEIETATGIRYVQFRLTKKMLIGVRESSGKEFTINLDELYRAYQECRRFSSPEVKRIIFMGHSPAVALLKWLKKETVNDNKGKSQKIDIHQGICCLINVKPLLSALKIKGLVLIALVF